jgi:hypothetical protein
VAEAFLAEVRRRCKALPEVTEGFTHGGPPGSCAAAGVILDAYRRVAPKTLVSRLDTA